MNEIWTKEKIEQIIKSDDYSYQNIELPYGLSTGGNDRSATARSIFPDDMSGKTVLDIGCKYGYFCFEAEKRGAKKVVGIDVDPDSIRKANNLKNILGSKVDFQLGNIENSDIFDEFDYILCLNILHHLKNPISIIDKIINKSTEKTILEVATLGQHDRKKIGLSYLYSYLLKKAPIIFVSENGSIKKTELQNFFITPSAVRNLMLHHRGDVARVDIQKSEQKGRFISISHKWKIDHLVVISGPTACGKKTFERNLYEKKYNNILDRLSLADDVKNVPLLFANNMSAGSDPEHKDLFLHYDFLRPYMRSAQVHERDKSLDILKGAKKITFVTLWATPERLQEQMVKAESKNGRAKKMSRRHLKIYKDYKDKNRVLEFYNRWISFASKYNADHIIVDMDDDMKIRSVDEWKENVSKELSGS